MQTAIVRRFNRSYTQRVGALEESFLGLGLPLGHTRVLYEVGSEPGTVQALRARLGLDSGYLSRLLRRLEADGLVVLAPDPADRRRRTVSLTAQGRSHWEELERRSEERARQLLEPLSERQRERLAQALTQADLLVRAATVSLETVSPTAPAARHAVATYLAEIGARFGYTTAAPGTPDEDAELAAYTDPHGAFVLAVSDGAPVACGAVQTIAPGVGEVKRMWVSDAWRGAGLGARLLRHLEGTAASLGHHTVRLDTNAALTEAIAMYERAGYTRVDRYNDNPHATHFYEKPLAAA